MHHSTDGKAHKNLETGLLSNNLQFKYYPYQQLIYFYCFQGNYAMLSFEHAIEMWFLDGRSLEKPIWVWTFDQEVFNVEGIHAVEIILTSSFCGFVQRVLDEEADNGIPEGFYRLVILDKKSGDLIYKIREFDSAFTLHCERTMAMPHIAASGDTVCLISANTIEENQVVCVKVNAERKQCKVRHAITKLEGVMLRWCLAAEESIGWMMPKSNDYNINVRAVDIIGMVQDRVVVGQLNYQFSGAIQNIEREKQVDSVVLFTIDTDKFFSDDDDDCDIDESSTALTTAFNLPLLTKIKDLMKSHRSTTYWPYYEALPAEEREPRLCGVVETDKTGKLISHTFRKNLDFVQSNEDCSAADKRLSDICRDLKKPRKPLLF